VQDLIAFHGEDTDLGIQHVTALFDPATQGLVVPDHVFERERNLLLGFVFYNLRNPVGLNGGQLNETRQ